ncbi:hypothetical protein LINPERHAP2_LOCUS41754 [Linum perenne]
MSVVGWIINSLELDISESMIDNDNAYELWKDMKEKYGEADSVRIAQLKGLISECKQGTSSVTEYFNRLHTFWVEFVSFRPIPHCECGVGVHTGGCNTYTAVKRYQDDDHVIDFIIGLNSEFDMTKNQLLFMDPPPTLKVAFKYALKLERQLKPHLKKAAGVESVALASTGSPHQRRASYQGRDFRNSQSSIGQSSTSSGNTEEKPALFYRYCKRENHNIEDCYRLKNKRRNEANGNRNFGNPRFTAAIGSEQHTGSGAGESTNDFSQGSNNSMVRLTAEDYTRLMALLQQKSGTASSSNPPTHHQAHSATTNITQLPHSAGKYVLTLHNHSHHSHLENACIIDIGASDHMCCSLTHFIETKPLANTFVTLPNGHKVSANHIGIIRTSGGLILTNVLHIPSFTFNLISVSKLTNTLLVSLTF